MQITHDLDIGGLQQVVVNICKTIDRSIFDISVLCLRRKGEFAPAVEEMGIEVLSIPQPAAGADYLSFLKVAGILKRKRIQVIHTHNTQPFIDGTIAALLSGVKKIIHTDHARDFPDKKRYMVAEWLMSQFASRVVGVSDHTSQNLERYERISRRKIVTIVNGIDENLYNITIDRKKKRKELGLSIRGPVIGLGVRLTEQKGITYLLQAMPLIIKAFPDISLVIAGKGPLRDSLIDESNALGISDNVYFVGPRLDMPELLKLFDLYVLPSLWEGLPMVLLECMAARCPILATRVGGNAIAITHDYTGSLIEPGNPARIAGETIRILSDEQVRKRYSITGYDVLRRHFTAEIMTRKYEKLYLNG
jgi:glycosyltransferase involved in cell wall biosynthesis